MVWHLVPAGEFMMHRVKPSESEDYQLNALKARGDAALEDLRELVDALQRQAEHVRTRPPSDSRFVRSAYP
jgi:hypothetical protein